MKLHVSNSCLTKRTSLTKQTRTRWRHTKNGRMTKIEFIMIRMAQKLALKKRIRKSKSHLFCQNSTGKKLR